MSEASLAAVGALLSDPTRSKILTILMDGRAHTGGELARYVGVAPSTVSHHLSRLLDSGMIAVKAQGRHRYFRLANAEVAALLESVGASPLDVSIQDRRADGLTFARTCYDHLAGRLAVRIHAQLVTDGHLVHHNHSVQLTESGYITLDLIGANTERIRNGTRPPALTCLDWSERVYHLAGAAGMEILRTLLANRWLTQGPRPRSIRVTNAGKAAIPEHFGIPPL